MPWVSRKPVQCPRRLAGPSDFLTAQTVDIHLHTGWVYVHSRCNSNSPQAGGTGLDRHDCRPKDARWLTAEVARMSNPARRPDADRIVIANHAPRA